EYGEADAFGHRKKANVGEDLSDEIKKRTKEETIISDLTYELRSGEADFVDKMVATTFANMALDAIIDNRSGQMAAIHEGRFAMVEIPDPKLGPRKVDIESMYNTQRYRPNYANKTGLPIFLTLA
ncbi:MAG: 6-phosphofructokinase, partial [Acidobacteria bacterium]|nr:6-phosphofructokinase [Acidobacteriota bacterium]